MALIALPALPGSPADQQRPSLCSNTVQVRPGDYNAVRVKDLEKQTVIEWLSTNGYDRDAYAIDQCGENFVHLATSTGYEKIVRMHCNNDYCPRCGKTGSQAHKKRSTRAMDRLLWSDLLGYMVFTLPREVSELRPSQGILSRLSKEAWQIVKKNFSAPGGLVRVHLLGEEPERLHIHINVLFPVTGTSGKGEVPQEVLDTIRGEWTKVVNDLFDLACEVTNVFYKFATIEGKRIHQVDYVLRPIVTSEKFLTLSDADRHYVLQLKVKDGREKNPGIIRGGLEN